MRREVTAVAFLYRVCKKPLIERRDCGHTYRRALEGIEDEPQLHLVQDTRVAGKAEFS